MEGAVLAGKLAAEVVAEKAAGISPTKADKAIEKSISEKTYTAKAPLGISGDGPFAYGGGAVLSKTFKSQLAVSDPAQLL